MDTILTFKAYNIEGELIDSVRLEKNNISTPIMENEKIKQNVVKDVSLSNYPNPFNLSTRFNFYIPEFGRVAITIYDINGSEVIKLMDKFYNKGKYSIEWNSKNRMGRVLSSGIYFVCISVNEYRKTQKIVLLK